MTKSNTDPAKPTGAGEPGQEGAPPVAAAEISTDCLMCGKNVLGGGRGFLRFSVQRFLVPGPNVDGTMSVAEILEQPEGESDLVVICTGCSMNALWVIAKRAITRHEQATEAADAERKH